MNYLFLPNTTLTPGNITVVFGPNGGGKTTLLDTLCFVRDCATSGADSASSAHSHGIGMLYAGASPGDEIEIEMATSEITYALRGGLSSGRIDPFPYERL